MGGLFVLVRNTLRIGDSCMDYVYASYPVMAYRLLSVKALSEPALIMSVGPFGSDSE